MCCQYYRPIARYGSPYPPVPLAVHVRQHLPAVRGGNERQQAAQRGRVGEVWQVIPVGESRLGVIHYSIVAARMANNAHPWQPSPTLAGDGAAGDCLFLLGHSSILDQLAGVLRVRLAANFGGSASAHLNIALTASRSLV